MDPTYGRAKAGRPARTYIEQLCEDTGCNPEDLPKAMNDREKWWERVRDVRAGGTTWWWWGIAKVNRWTKKFFCWMKRCVILENILKINVIPIYYYYYYYYYYLLLKSFSHQSFTGVWVTASLLKSPGLFSIFWPFSIMQ